MKTLITLSIALLSFTASFAVNRDSTDLKVGSLNYFYVEYRTVSKTGVVCRKAVGLSVVHTRPTTEDLSLVLGRVEKSAPVKIKVLTIVPMSETEYNSYFSHKR